MPPSESEIEAEMDGWESNLSSWNDDFDKIQRIIAEVRRLQARVEELKAVIEALREPTLEQLGEAIARSGCHAMPIEERAELALFYTAVVDVTLARLREGRRLIAAVARAAQPTDREKALVEALWGIASLGVPGCSFLAREALAAHGTATEEAKDV